MPSRKSGGEGALVKRFNANTFFVLVLAFFFLLSLAGAAFFVVQANLGGEFTETFMVSIGGMAAFATAGYVLWKIIGQFRGYLALRALRGRTSLFF